MDKSERLPGVSSDNCPPVIVTDTRSDIRRARIRATFRDLGQLLFLGAIDYFFFNWPLAHIPFLSRGASAFVVVLLNAIILTHVIMMRMLPRMRAKRIAATWRLSERARFFATTRQP
ncbi:MAG: hypothetical protein JJE51_00280 [Thermoanaerobaculia bacterium]|nr:hypothetical protein [Thermoanaerobaculia bacterium]